MAKPLTQIVKDLNKANDAYHASIEDLLECEDLKVEQRAVIGGRAVEIFQKMLDLSKILANYMG